MVIIFSCCLSNQNAWEDTCKRFLDALSDDNRARVLKMTRKEDQVRHLLGRMLLQQAMDYVGYKTYSLADICIDCYGKPFIPGGLQFSISHSGAYVFCAVSLDEFIGIDIEQIKAIEFEFVQNTMHENEWKIIHRSANPLRSFYLRWCMKESALKADGRGLYIPLEDIHIGKGVAEIQNLKWYLSPLSFDPDYCGCIATSRLPGKTKLIVVNPDDFVKNSAFVMPR